MSPQFVPSHSLSNKTSTTLIREGGYLPSVPGSPSQVNGRSSPFPVFPVASKIPVQGGEAPSGTTTPGPCHHDSPGSIRGSGYRSRVCNRGGSWYLSRQYLLHSSPQIGLQLGLRRGYSSRRYRRRVCNRGGSWHLSH